MIATGGGTVYWSRGYFGYGYGLWRAYHYPWFVDAFPLALWFPWPGWMPAYYVSDQQALERFDSQGGQAPPMQDNPQFAQLPRLPSFESLGIDIRRLDRFEGATLDANQRAVVDDMKQRLSTELDKLRAQYRQQAAQGFFPVPDMDAGRFEWVKVTVQNQQ